MSYAKTITRDTRSKKYYINLSTNNGCFNRLDIDINSIIDVNITDNNQLVITTDEIVEGGYTIQYTPYTYKNKVHTSVEDFIIDTYVNITKGIVKSLCYYSKTTKSGKTVYPNYSALIDIVKSGYNDIFFDDLSQEVALYMVEHKNVITCNAGIYDISSIHLELYKIVRNYIYNNKLKLDKTQVSIIGYSEESNNDISIAINSRAYIDHCLDSYNDLSIRQAGKFWDIIENVKIYIGFTQKPKVANKCKGMLDLMIQGYKIKDISIQLNISSTTATKYKNIIQNAFYKCYKKPISKNEKLVDKTTIDNTDKITIDFSKVVSTIEDNAKNSLIDNVNNYYHLQKQAFYNLFFGAYNPLKLSSKINNIDMIYCRELQLDRNF